MRMRGGADCREGRLMINGRYGSDLAEEFGTPLYVYNENTIRVQCTAILEALKAYPGKSGAFFASKAFPNIAVNKVVHQVGIGVDVSSHGELCVALKAGIPGRDIIVEGAMKKDAYIEAAVTCDARLIVIDAMSEIDRVESIAAKQGKTVDVLIRVNPGVEAETHKAVRTANLDTKFGIPLLEGMARRAVDKASKQPHLRMRGIHCHVGSQVFKMDVYDVASGMLLDFMKETESIGVKMDILDLGGGFGAWYSRGDTPMQMVESVQMVTQAVQGHCTRLKMDLPELMIEPGRSIVAESAVALYTVEAVKEIPGVNTYLVTDGGLFENPRPHLYGSKYTAYLVNRVDAKAERYYTVAGSSCESDTIIPRVKLPLVREGDLLAIPSAGAYQLAMAGNYNRMPKPAAVLVNDSRAALIARRQTFDEVLANEEVPADL